MRIYLARLSSLSRQRPEKTFDVCVSVAFLLSVSQCCLIFQLNRLEGKRGKGHKKSPTVSLTLRAKRPIEELDLRGKRRLIEGEAFVEVSYGKFLMGKMNWMRRKIILPPKKKRPWLWGKRKLPLFSVQNFFLIFGGKPCGQFFPDLSGPLILLASAFFPAQLLFPLFSRTPSSDAKAKS